MHEYTFHRPGRIITDLIDGFITNNFRLISVPNKIPNLPNKKAFSNSMCPTDVKQMNDTKEVIKYTDHSHQDFWTFAWGTTSKEDQHE
jgi:hypothetical protein